MQKKASMRGLLMRIFGSLYWGFALRAVVLAILLWLAIWAIWGDSIAYLGYLNAGAILWGLAALLTSILFFVRLEKYWGIFALLIALAVLIPGNGFSAGQLFASETAKAPGSTRIVSASLRGRNRNMAAAAKRLAEYQADIIAAQEVSNKQLLHRQLEMVTGERWQMASRGSLAIFSKTPIRTLAASKMPSLLKIEVTVRTETLTIWSLRAPKNYAKPIENTGFYVALERMVEAEQPDVVLGDFNATFWNDGYARLSKHMKNSHVEAGFGFGPSFPARGRRSGLFGAYARIDHIFLRQRIRPVAAFTGDASKGADHHPVVADISF